MKLSIILSQLSTGMAGTISIFVLTLVFSLPLGLLIAFGRMSKNRIVSGIFRLYISLMRGTPLMLQLMVVLPVFVLCQILHLPQTMLQQLIMFSIKQNRLIIAAFIPLELAQRVSKANPLQKLVIWFPMVLLLLLMMGEEFSTLA